jgi:hypothetical protein
MSKQTGFTAEQLQKYQFAASQGGVAQDKFNTGLQAFGKRIGELKQGTGGLFTFLQKYDAELANTLANTSNTNEAFLILADRFSKITDESTRSALGAAAFSRSAGIELAAALSTGTDSLLTLGNQLAETGAIMSNEAVAGAEAANDAMERLGKATGGVVAVFAIELAPAIETVATWLAVNIPNAFAKTRLAVSDFIESFLDAHAAVSDFILLILSFPDKVARTIEQTVTRAGNAMRELAGGVLDKAKNFFGGVVDAASDMLDAVAKKSFVPEMVDLIRDSIGLLDSYMVQPVIGFSGTVVDTFQNMARQIGDIFADVLLGVRSFGEALKDLGRSILNDVVRGITGSISGSILGGLGISAAGSSVGTAAAGGLGGLFGGLFGGASTSSGAGRRPGRVRFLRWTLGGGRDWPGHFKVRQLAQSRGSVAGYVGQNSFAAGRVWRGRGGQYN